MEVTYSRQLINHRETPPTRPLPSCRRENKIYPTLVFQTYFYTSFGCKERKERRVRSKTKGELLLGLPGSLALLLLLASCPDRL